MVGAQLAIHNDLMVVYKNKMEEAGYATREARADYETFMPEIQLRKYEKQLNSN